MKFPLDKINDFITSNAYLNTKNKEINENSKKQLIISDTL
jgi:hypothetical protein